MPALSNIHDSTTTHETQLKMAKESAIMGPHSSMIESLQSPGRVVGCGHSRPVERETAQDEEGRGEEKQCAASPPRVAQTPRKGVHSLAIIALPSNAMQNQHSKHVPASPTLQERPPAGLARTSFGAWISMASNAQLCKARLRHPQLAVSALPPSRSWRATVSGSLSLPAG